MTPNHSTLEALARAATPGPWFDCDVLDAPGGAIINKDDRRVARLEPESDDFSDDERCMADAAYIASANPQAILAILAQLRAAQGVIEAARDFRKEYGHKSLAAAIAEYDAACQGDAP